MTASATTSNDASPDRRDPAAEPPTSPNRAVARLLAGPIGATMWRLAAPNIAGFLKVADSMMDQGLV